MARFLEKQREALASAMQDEVFRVASEILREEGFAGLTMERIARQAGVSRGTLYNYFDDRDAVLDLVEERTIEPMLDATREIAAGDLPADEKLARIAEWIFSAAFKDRALIIALVPVKAIGTHRSNQARRRAAALQAVEQVVSQGIAAGLFKDLPKRQVAETYLSTIAGLLDGMTLSGELRPAEQIVPTMMEILLGGLRSATAPCSPGGAAGGEP